MNLSLATRSSPLALWQAETTRAALEAALPGGPGAPGAPIELVPVSSIGDRDRATDLARFGSIGVFTVEVDRALLDGRARIGVHSMKDMLTTLEDGIVLAGVLPRGPVEDAFLSRDGKTLDELPAGARVATGSMRRRAMLLRARSDVEVVGIRGNIETRLAKLDAGEADALLLARAGLFRLGMAERATEILDTTRFLPPVGQAIVGLTCRADDTEARELLARIRDADAWSAALAERAFLRELRGGCNVPVGAHATIDGEALGLAAQVLSLDGKRCIEGSRAGLWVDAEALGESLASELADAGARALIEGVRS